MSHGIRAFSDPRYDYYELQKDLEGLVPKGAIFVHDVDDQVYGSIANGCLKLCWTPDGNTYRGNLGSLCAGTVIFHTAFSRTSLFKRVKTEEPGIKTEFLQKLQTMKDEVDKLIDEVRSSL